MVNPDTTDLFGIQIPSTDKAFLTLIGIHIALGLFCVISGLVAMLSTKGSEIHIKSGKIYFWSVSALYLSIVAASVIRWPFNIHLLIIGSIAFALAFTGRQLAKNKKHGWSRLHTICMGLSYILLLTGFYVDNGKNLPFWNQFPEWFFWVMPTLTGVPIIIFALIRHPLNKKNYPGL